MITQGPGFTEDTVLDFVTDLHVKNPAKQEFTLTEVAAAMAPDQVAAFKAGAVDGLMWIESLNNVLKKLGFDGKLQVTFMPDENGVQSAVINFAS